MLEQRTAESKRFQEQEHDARGYPELETVTRGNGHTGTATCTSTGTASATKAGRATADAAPGRFRSGAEILRERATGHRGLPDSASWRVVPGRRGCTRPRVRRLAAALAMLAGVAAALGPMPAAQARENLPEMKNKIYHATSDLWNKVAHDALKWSPAMSMALPAAWPPDGGGKIVFYLCAYAQDPHARTRYHVSTCYAKVTMDAREKEPLKIEQLTKQIESVGMAGLPLAGPDEWNKIDKAQASLVELMLAKDAKLSDFEDIKAPLCRWTEFNSAFGAQIARLHPAYFKWLGCTSDESGQPERIRSSTRAAPGPNPSATPGALPTTLSTGTGGAPGQQAPATDSPPGSAAPSKGGAPAASPGEAAPGERDQAPAPGR